MRKNKPKKKRQNQTRAIDMIIANQYYHNSKASSSYSKIKSKKIKTVNQSTVPNSAQIEESRKGSPGYCRKCGAIEFRNGFCWECYKDEKTQ